MTGEGCQLMPTGERREAAVGTRHRCQGPAPRTSSLQPDLSSASNLNLWKGQPAGGVRALCIHHSPKPPLKLPHGDQAFSTGRSLWDAPREAQQTGCPLPEWPAFCCGEAPPAREVCAGAPQTFVWVLVLSSPSLQWL